MANVKNFRVEVKCLHPGDQVYLGDRLMNVLEVNRASRRVLCAGRKHQTKNFSLRWIDAVKLGTRPRSISRRKFRSVAHLVAITGDGVTDWFPSRTCKPTDYAPGSAGKIEALRHRVARGETLWSSQDADHGGKAS